MFLNLIFNLGIKDASSQTGTHSPTASMDELVSTGVKSFKSIFYQKNTTINITRHVMPHIIITKYNGKQKNMVCGMDAF